MSTRCQILIDGASVVIYRHSDGYPDGEHGVLAALVPLVQAFCRVRGHDPDYLAAQVLAGLVREHHDWCDAVAAQLRAEGRPVTHCDEQGRVIGFGVEGYPDSDTLLHGDIAYLYVVCRHHIEVRQPTKAFYAGDAGSIASNTKLVRRVALDGAATLKKAKRAR